MNTTRARLVTVCLSLLLLGASLGFAAPPHKVLAAPGQLDANAPGVVLWHDYGSFAPRILWTAPGRSWPTW